MIVPLIRANRRRLLAAAALSLCAAGLNVVLLDYLHGVADGIGMQSPATWLPVYAAGVAGLFAASLLAKLLLVRQTSGTVAALRETLLQRMVGARYRDLERAGKGRLLAMLTDDVENMSAGLAIAPQCLFNLVTIVLCLAYLASLSAKALALFLAVLSAGVALSALLVSRGNRHLERYRLFKEEYYRHLHAMFDGAKEIATDARRRAHFLAREATPSIGRLREAELKQELSWHVGEVWVRAFLFIALGAAVLATRTVGAGAASLTMSYFVVITFIAGPIEAVIHASSFLAKALQSSRRVAALEFAPRPCDLECTIAADWREIRFEDVSYRWDSGGEEAFGFGPVSLTVRRGEVLFLTGGNGSGKSTFAKLLLGLYARQDGRILVDDQAVAPEPGERYKAMFSAIFSDGHLFPALLDAQGAPATDAAVGELLERVGLGGKVSHREGVLSTTSLSQGQRKRLALVQAWLQASEVYVLDEWAADQDPVARDHFYREVLPRMQRDGKTLVVVSHDDRYFALADRVVTFEQGRVRDVRESKHAHGSAPHGAIRPPPAPPHVLSFVDLT